MTTRYRAIRGAPLWPYNIENIHKHNKLVIHGTSFTYICLFLFAANSTNTIYTRRCALPSEENICSQLKKSTDSNSNLKMTECNICNSDYCNNSSSLMYSIYNILFSFLFIIYFL